MRKSQKPLLLVAALGVAAFAFCGVCNGINSMIGGGDDEAAPGSRPAAAVAPGGTTPGGVVPSASAATQVTTPAPTKAAPSPTPVYFTNCDAVRKAGKAPLRRGLPGYRAALDRDADGVACEQTEGSTGGQPKTQPKASPKPKPQNDPRYSTCAKAKAAGYGPYRRGVDPEYSWYRDADSDGVVCE
ncbi:excalibur calcium-binding domain-containing protein [Catellatospora methionotrophica]|uniref:excalibur calcium-binding domain-containing protein n=1 Tax=Catellatospora methionotrophica TaxID=121620 RepID=UPI0033D18593